MRKKLISIRIDPGIYGKAREMGLNISRTCENCLKQEIQRLTASDCPTNHTSTLNRATQPSRFVELQGLRNNPGVPGSPRA